MTELPSCYALSLSSRSETGYAKGDFLLFTRYSLAVINLIEIRLLRRKTALLRVLLLVSSLIGNCWLTERITHKVIRLYRLSASRQSFAGVQTGIVGGC
jgi:hypothetical protein